MRKILFPLALALFGVMLILWITLPKTPAWWTAYVFGTVTVMALLVMKEIKSTAEYPAAMSETARENALDVLEKHGFRAHYYLPQVGVEDKELAGACRLLAGTGFLITDSTGALVGKVATARLTPAELTKERRASFRLVKTEK